MRYLVLSFILVFTTIASAKPSTISKKDAELEKLVKAICTHMENDMSAIGYDALVDVPLMNAVKNVARLIDEGANPNIYHPEDLKIIFEGLIYGDTSISGAIVLIAGVVNQPELVEKMIQHGLDIHHATNSGWKAIDYAIMNYDGSQGTTTTRLKSAIKIIDLFQKAGMKLDEATAANELVEAPNLRHLREISYQLLTLRVLTDLGLMSEKNYEEAAIGREDLRAQMMAWDRVDLDVLKKDGVTLNNYTNELPSDTYTYKVTDDETLKDVAARFSRVMGSKDVEEATTVLLRTNQVSSADAKLPADQKIVVPLRFDVDIALRDPPAETWPAIAEKLKNDEVFYRKDASLEEITNELIAINHLKTPLDTAELASDLLVLIPYTKDRYEEFASLKPPATYDKNRVATLFVIESHDTKVEHDRHTYRVAENVGKAINADFNFSRVQSWNEVLITYPYDLKHSDGLRQMLNLSGSELQDRVIFSHSMGIDSMSARAEVYRDRRGEDNFDFNSIYSFQKYLEIGKPIIFHSAGNFNLSEGLFTPMYDIVHSPRTIMVGAAGRYQPGKAIISPYSSQGGDICAPIPKRRAHWMEGTSFSTPLLASMFRQFSEWYGNVLTFEEMMAAAMWSADTDLSMFTDLQGANAAVLNGDPKKFANLATTPADYVVNGGGLVHNEQCGAGLVDEVKWQAGLDWMVANKKAPTQEISQFLPLNRVKSESDFVYEVTIPQDMMLGKLTFLLPQFRSKHSDITVTTPAGFSFKLARTTTDVLSTYVFAYESVKAGSKITISTWREIAPRSGIQLRGFGPQSVIEAYRDFAKATRTAKK